MSVALLPDSLLIRPESAADQAAIAVINRQAFAVQAHSDQQEDQLVAALRQAGALSLSLLAEAGGEALAHVAFTPVLFDALPCNWFALAPLAVLPAWQRRGIGSALAAEGLRRLAASGAAGCVVLGEPAYYRRFGFRAGLTCEFAVPAGYFMALPFAGTDWPKVAEVAFHPLFGTPAGDESPAR